MDGFWEYHGLLYLFGLAIFPRFFLLFCNIPGSIIFWLGWFFLPRITVAVLATIFYYSTNPLLVILSWFFALGGESAEKKYGYKFTSRKINKKKIETIDYEIIDE